VADLQQILQQADSEQVDWFRDQAKQGWSEDKLALLDLLLDGTTPWRAARQLHDQGVTERSIHTLYYLARSITEEIHRQFGRSVDSWMEELRLSGEIRDVPMELLPTIRDRCQAMGWRIEEPNVVRIKDHIVNQPRSEGSDTSGQQS